MWFRIELFVFLSLIVVNVLFFFMRSIMRHTEQLDFQDEMRKLPETDAIDALQNLTSNFTNVLIPAMVSVLTILTAMKDGDHGNGLLYNFCVL